MRIFVTGANGFVGSALVTNLLAAGHHVSGLTRSDAGAASLFAAGAEAIRGDLQDLEGLRAAASASDGVIHTAFNHDFTKFGENCEIDRLAIEAIGAALQGTQRRLVITSGLPGTPGRVTTEEDLPVTGGSPRLSEQAATALFARGVRVSVVRMSQVHDRDKQGMATYMIAHARATGVSAYIGDGMNRWSGVHRHDAAMLYRLAIENGDAGARYHAVSEQDISVRAVAEAIGHGLGLPVKSLSPGEGAEHFGWLARPVSMDAPSSSERTRQALGWKPAQTNGFLADLQNSTLFAG